MEEGEGKGTRGIVRVCVTIGFFLLNVVTVIKVKLVALFWMLLVVLFFFNQFRFSFPTS